MRSNEDYQITEDEVREEIRKLKAAGKTVVDKVWGWELWLENNEKYCGKLLYIMPGFQSSLHYHRIKDETFIALRGLVFLQLDEIKDYDYRLLCSWKHDSQRIFPGTPHRFWSLDGPAIVMEVSTKHDDEDVVRLLPSGNLEGSSYTDQ